MSKNYQTTLNFERNPSFSCRDFVESPENSAALDHILSWPIWKGGILFIYGRSSCGKSHLGKLWAEYASAYVISEYDLHDTPRSVIKKGLAFLIDDLSGLLSESNNRQKAELWLFDFINVCKEVGKYILITNKEADLDLTLEDLISRLKSVIFVKISPPSIGLLNKITRQIGMGIGLALPESVINHLVEKSDRNVSSIKKFIDFLDETSLSTKEKINTQFIDKYISNFF